jgi:hypothetical protein
VQAAPRGEQRNPAGGQEDPQAIERPAGTGDGDGERADELDRNRDAEREAVQRLVKHEVHQSGRQPEQDSVGERAARVVAEVGPPDRDKYDGGESHAHEGGAAGTERRKEVLRHGGAELHRGDADQHEAGRRDPKRRTPQCAATAWRDHDSAYRSGGEGSVQTSAASRAAR